MSSVNPKEALKGNNGGRIFMNRFAELRKNTEGNVRDRSSRSRINSGRINIGSGSNSRVDIVNRNRSSDPAHR